MCRPRFSYFMSAKVEMRLNIMKNGAINKAKIALEITKRIEWFEKEGSEEEKIEAKRMLEQFKVCVLFWNSTEFSYS